MSPKIEVDEDRIKHAVHGGYPIAISSFTLPRSIERYINDVLMCILKELNMEHIYDYIAYCIAELTVNGKKANTKRIYFQEKGLDIHKQDDYEQGMIDFKEDTLTNIDYYLQKQKESGLYIKVVFQVINKKLIIEIRNNSEMLMSEYVRIHDRLARSRKFDRNDTEQIAKLVDDSEGAGLGLILIMQMFRKIGLSEDNYEVVVANGETITRITIPIEIGINKNVEILSTAISGYVSQLATFPENIVQLQEMIKNPDVEIADIAHFIATDVALTADLLRFVNSASFALGKQCSNITEAVKFMGLRSLKNLLYGYGSQEILGTSTPEQKKLWNHCYRVGYYAYNLVKNFSMDKTLLEDVYTCGILHDMGKVVFYNLYSDFSSQMNTICTKNNISPYLFEAVIGGSNHAEIGVRIAEKWRFPEKLINAIKFHHDPLSAPSSVRKTVFYVYLANSIANYVSGEIEFYQINKEVLSDFSITAEESFKDLANQLESGYQNNSGISKKSDS